MAKLTFKHEETNTKFPDYRDPQFIHDHDIYGIVNGGITCVYNITKNGGKLVYAFTRCNPKDQFSRKLGRKYALEEIKKKHVYSLNWDDVVDFVDVYYNNHFLKTPFLKGINFDWLTSECIKKILRIDILRRLGRDHYEYDTFMDLYSDSEDGTSVYLPCLLCKHMAEVVATDNPSHCEECDCAFLDLVLDFIDEDEYEDWDDDSDDDDDDLEDEDEEESSRE